MGLLDKFKQILFDEDVVEVPEENDELPERTSKKDKKMGREEKAGFIEYHHEEEEIDENPIKEIKIPKEEIKHEEIKTPEFEIPTYEKVEEKKIEPVGFEDKFKDDFMDDFDNQIDDFKVGSSRSSKYDDLELSFMDDKDDVKDVTIVNSYRVNDSQRKEIKDYRKMLSDETQETSEKKPFKNTPVISPVWGILDKNYTPDEIVDKTETLNQINCGVVPRTYGPVSYNDQPLPTHKNKVTKEELVELNSTISEMVTEEIVEEKVEIKEEVKNITPEIKYEEEVKVEEVPSYQEQSVEEFVEEYTEPTHSVVDFDDEDDSVIQTTDYDSYEEVSFDNNLVEEEEEEIEMPTHSIQDVHESIESSITEQNSIEDAFENTSEFNSINQRDEEDVPEVDFETIVPKKKYNDDDEGLDNTIETDLFNLIDSMYKDEEDE